MPNFRPVLNILPVDFGGGVLVVPGEKQSQLLDLSLGLGLEFDNNNSSDNIFVNQNVYIIDCIFL